MGETYIGTNANGPRLHASGDDRADTIQCEHTIEVQSKSGVRKRSTLLLYRGTDEQILQCRNTGT